MDSNPSFDGANGTNGTQDPMQRFNIATAPIRDTLKAIEGSTIPSLNIVAWIAQNVKVLPVPGQEDEGRDGDDRKFEIVMGGDGMRGRRWSEQGSQKLKGEFNYSLSKFYRGETNHKSFLGRKTFCLFGIPILRLQAQQLPWVWTINPVSTETSPVKPMTASKSLRELDEAAFEAHYASMAAETEDDEDGDEVSLLPSEMVVKREVDTDDGMDRDGRARGTWLGYLMALVTPHRHLQTVLNLESWSRVRLPRSCCDFQKQFLTRCSWRRDESFE